MLKYTLVGGSVSGVLSHSSILLNQHILVNKVSSEDKMYYFGIYDNLANTSYEVNILEVL